MTGAPSGRVPPAWCEHGRGHDGGVPSAATAPAGARAWLLIEFGGPWAEEATATGLPVPLAKLAIGADELGVRVQLIRRPARPGPARPSRRDDSGRDGSGRDDSGRDDSGRDGSGRDDSGRDGSGRDDRGRDDSGRAGRGEDRHPAVFAGWTAGAVPWVRRISSGDLDQAVLTALAAGVPPGGPPAPGPLFLVCTHGRRDRCCARFGVPLARQLAARYPDEVWETTHVGGHRFAANLVILPHGLYYGPVDLPSALRAIDAYQRGRITADGYRGRAGQSAAAQEADCARATRPGTLRL